MSSLESELLTHAAALRRLACALVGSADAEDLVQETALRALRSPPLRPGGLGAFFATILRRLAGTQRRAAHRRAQREQACAKSETGLPADHALAHGEMLQQLTTALMAMPAPYREALLQRYFEDLSPAQIARRHGLALATVKTRLQRGLQQLRAKLGADGREWRGALVSAFGLEHVALATAGVVVMGTGAKCAVGVAAALLTASVFWFVAQQSATTAASAASPREEVRVATVATDSRADVREEVRREPAAPAGIPDAAAMPGVVRGRCIDVVTRTPLSGCTASMRLVREGAAAATPVEMVTGSDGCFVLSAAVQQEGPFGLEIRADGRLGRTARLDALRAGATVDLGDVELSAGAAVHGRVVGPGGQPIAKCHVSLMDLPIAFGFRSDGGERIHTESKEDGTFAFAEIVPPGTWQLEAGRAGWCVVTPRSVTVPAGTTALDVAVTCAATPSIAGFVVDDRNRPIAKVTVQPVLKRSGRYASARTEADGSFELFALEPDPAPQRLEVGQAEGHELPPPTDEIPWGTRDVRFVLQRGVSIAVEVVERATGRPVRSFAVTAPKEKGPWPSRQWSVDLAEDGRIGIDGLERGSHLVAVLPQDAMLLPDQKLVEVAPGLPRVRFELERMEAVRIVVQDEQAQPIPEARVEVLHLGKIDVPKARDFRRTWPALSQLPIREDFHPVRYAAGKTGPEGHVSLGFPGNDTDLGLRATARGFAQGTLRHPVVVPGQPLVVTLAAAASLHGSVKVAGYPSGRALLVLADDELADHVTNIDLTSDGSFHAEDLVPGARLLYLAVRLDGSPWLLDPPLQRIVLPRSEATVQLDASRFDAGCVRGRVIVDGQGVAGRQIDLFAQLTRPGTSHRTRVGKGITDERGAFTVTGVLPGPCALRLQIEDHGAATWVAHADQLTVPAGGTVEQEFHFTPRRLRVRVLDGQGRALASRKVWVRMPTGERCAESDAAGLAVFDWMPVGVVVLSDRQPLLPKIPVEGKEIELPVDRETTVEFTVK